MKYMKYIDITTNVFIKYKQTLKEGRNKKCTFNFSIYTNSRNI